MSRMKWFHASSFILNSINFLGLHTKILLLRVFFSWACGGPFSLFAVRLLKILNWQLVDIKNLEGHAKLNLKLAMASSSTVSEPSFNGQEGKESIQKFKCLKAYLLQNEKIVATPYSPAIISGKSLLLPMYLLRTWARVRTGSGGLFNIKGELAFGRIDVAATIEEGILIGGAGAFNWFHFMLEVLPKVFLSKYLPSQFDKMPFLVPDECRKFPQFSSALAYFSGDRPLQYIKNGEFIGLQRLVVFDEISVSPFNLAPNEWPRGDDYGQNDAFLRLFIDEFCDKVLGSESSKTKTLANVPRNRIFLTRPGVRRRYNQDELLKIASRYGFKPFSSENFSLEEQAKVFSESSMVVGPSGAAWVGMIFRRAPLRGLTWLPSEYKHFCSYSSLANLLNHQLDFIEAKTLQPLKSTDEAFSSDYQVCPIQFEIALKRMVGQNP